MKEITLSDGSVMMVDDDSFDFVNRWKWKRHVNGYACRTGWDKERQTWTCILVHRLLMGETASRQIVIDHINGNKLDNRKENLRIVSQTQNNYNRHVIDSRNTSGFTGVSWDKARGKWMAKTKHNGKIVYIGRYESAEAANLAYQEVVKQWA